jgi:hypothetical protein
LFSPNYKPALSRSTARNEEGTYLKSSLKKKIKKEKKSEVLWKVEMMLKGGRMAMAAVATAAALLGLVCIAIGVNIPLTQQYFPLYLCHVLSVRAHQIKLSIT